MKFGSKYQEFIIWALKIGVASFLATISAYQELAIWALIVASFEIGYTFFLWKKRSGFNQVLSRMLAGGIPFVLYFFYPLKTICFFILATYWIMLFSLLGQLLLNSKVISKKPISVRIQAAFFLGILFFLIAFFLPTGLVSLVGILSPIAIKTIKVLAYFPLFFLLQDILQKEAGRPSKKATKSLLGILLMGLVMLGLYWTAIYGVLGAGIALLSVEIFNSIVVLWLFWTRHKKNKRDGA